MGEPIDAACGSSCTPPGGEPQSVGKCAHAVSEAGLACAHCGETFESRNRLFRHLKEKCDPSAGKVVDQKERILLVAGYLGSRYFGCLQGSDEDVRPTVEGAIIRAVGRAWDEPVLSISRSTRTEKGMHAIENVFVITVNRRGPRSPSRCEVKLRQELESLDVWLIAPASPPSPGLFDKVHDCKKRVFRFYVPYFALVRPGQEQQLSSGSGLDDLGVAEGLWLGIAPGSSSDNVSVASEVVALLSRECGLKVAEADVVVAERGGHACVRMSQEAAVVATWRLHSLQWNGKALGACPIPEAKAKINLQRKIRTALKALRGPPKGLRDFHNFILDATPGGVTAMRNLQHLSGGAVGEEVRAGGGGGNVPSAQWTDVEWTTVCFSAKDFGPQQLRRMMSAMVAVVRGVEDVAFIDKCFKAEPMTLLPAPVEALALESVQFGQWNSDWRGAANLDVGEVTRGQRRVEERVVAESVLPWREFVARLDVPGATRLELQKELSEAATTGAAERVKAALAAGAVVDAVDEYGQTALFLAACAGQTDSIRVLVDAHADVERAANGGSTPAASAAAAGHTAAVQALFDAKANPNAPGLAGKTPLAYLAETPLPNACPAPSSTPVRTVVIPGNADHAGAGTVYVDGALSDDTLDWLAGLWHRLPLAPKDKASPTERAYFADTEGWVTREFARAVEAAQLPFDALVMPHMRFLNYPEPGGSLPPHVDLSRVDSASGQRSTHTFLLYLSDCNAGGETTFLQCLDGDAALADHGGLAPGPRGVVGAVAPKRGRFLLMPHACPHLAAPTFDVPKVLVRGEVMPAACTNSR